MNIAYVRVSTVEQNEARQIEALSKYNIEKMNKSELAKALGVSRPTLNKMINEYNDSSAV